MVFPIYKPRNTVSIKILQGLLNHFSVYMCDVYMKPILELYTQRTNRYLNAYWYISLLRTHQKKFIYYCQCLFGKNCLEWKKVLTTHRVCFLFPASLTILCTTLPGSCAWFPSNMKQWKKAENKIYQRTYWNVFSKKVQNSLSLSKMIWTLQKTDTGCTSQFLKKML